MFKYTIKKYVYYIYRKKVNTNVKVGAACYNRTKLLLSK